MRDEAKMLGGVGVCGRPFCCSTFLGGFQPVSIKMAKEQGLSLNPVKISGICGRLMCCLKYEQETYAGLMKVVPAVNAAVMTPQGRGVVADRNLLSETVSVRLNVSPDSPPRTFRADEVKVLKTARAGRPRTGQSPPKNAEDH